jgi:hypothetical protein
LEFVRGAGFDPPRGAERGFRSRDHESAKISTPAQRELVATSMHQCAADPHTTRAKTASVVQNPGESMNGGQKTFQIDCILVATS